VASAQPQHSGIYALSLDSKEQQLVLNVPPPSFTNAVYASPGYLLFVRDAVLMALPFDVERRQATGEPVPVAAGVPFGYGFSASDNGVIAYKAGVVLSNQLVWTDRSGRRLGVVGEPAIYTNPALSPDDRRLAVGRLDPQTGTRDIWLFDLPRNTGSRLTFDPADDIGPAWSPDGSRVLFSSDRKGQRDIYQKAANGAGGDELFLASDQLKSINDQSSDGRFVVYDSSRAPADLWTVPLIGDRKPVPLANTPFDERSAQVSPDGKWVAYTSNESGRHQVYVQTFPEPRSRWQVSSGEGVEPRWRRDGKELFYYGGRMLWAVDVKPDATTFEAGVPKALFEMRVPEDGLRRNRFVVTADGQRFLFVSPAGEASAAPFTVVVNWTPNPGQAASVGQ
jgi:Tol biopolymer transport system component